MPRSLRLLLLVVLSGLAWAAPASAAPGFVADENLDPGVGVGEANVAIAPDGRAAAAWVEALPGGASAVRVASREPGGSWVTSAPLDTNTRFKSSMHVAVDARGAVAATWQDTSGSTTFVAVVSRAPGADFGAVQLLNKAAIQTYVPAVGLDGASRATLTFFRGSTRLAVDFPAGGSAGAATPQTVASDCSGVNAFVVAPNGDAAAALECGGAQFAVRRNGVWSVSPLLGDSNTSDCSEFGGTSTSSSNTARSVVVDGAGRFAGLLEYEYATGPCGFNTRNVSGELRVAVEQNGVLTPVGGTPIASGASPSEPSARVFSGAGLGIGPGGLTVTWGDALGDAPFCPLLRTADLAGNSGSPATTVAGPPSGSVVRPVLATGPAGHALLTWGASDTTASTTQAVGTGRSPGGAFADGQAVSTPSATAVEPVANAVDAAGNGLAAYVTLPSSGLPELHVRGYDAVAPALSGVGIPGAATAGSAVAFGAAATDLFGPVRLSWDFGDGTSATGTAPSHAFAAAGTRTVTVTATDAAGNASTQSGSIVVAAAAGGASTGGGTTGGGTDGGGSAGGGTISPAVPPVLSRVALDRTRFRVGPRSTAVAARARRAPAGATLSYTLDRAAAVTIAVARTTSGRRSGQRCVAATTKNHKAKRCTRHVPIKTLRRASKAGTTRVAFSGRFAGKALRAGTYTLTLGATAIGRASRLVTVTLHIVH